MKMKIIALLKYNLKHVQINGQLFIRIIISLYTTQMVSVFLIYQTMCQLQKYFSLHLNNITIYIINHGPLRYFFVVVVTWMSYKNLVFSKIQMCLANMRALFYVFFFSIDIFFFSIDIFFFSTLQHEWVHVHVEYMDLAPSFAICVWIH